MELKPCARCQRSMSAAVKGLPSRVAEQWIMISVMFRIIECWMWNEECGVLNGRQADEEWGMKSEVIQQSIIQHSIILHRQRRPFNIPHSTFHTPHCAPRTHCQIVIFKLSFSKNCIISKLKRIRTWGNLAIKLPFWWKSRLFGFDKVFTLYCRVRTQTIVIFASEKDRKRWFESNLAAWDI